MTDYDEDRKASGSNENRHVPGGCPVCGKAHLTQNDLPSCHSHLTNRVGDDGLPIPCRRRPVGTAHGKLCPLHGGTRKTHRGAAGQRAALMAITEELKMLGREIDVTPTEAMLAAVRESAGNVAFLRGLVQQLSSETDDNGRAPVMIDDDGVARVERAWTGAGIATRTSPADWRTAPHVLVGMYNEERDRLVRFSKLCRDAGVEEARVLIEAQQGEWLVRTLDSVLGRLELTPEQEAALPGIMGRVIAELETGESERIVDVEEVVGIDDEQP